MRVVLIVPDAGPLISLARINGLDLLLRLGLPIYLVDQVRFEVTREKDRLLDARRIDDWICAHPETVSVFEPPSGARLRDVAPRAKRGSPARARRPSPNC